MDVIGHDDVSPHEPAIGVNPNIPQKVMDIRLSQDWLLLVGADGEEDDRGPAGRFARGQMHRCFALDTFIHNHRRDALCRVRVVIIVGSVSSRHVSLSATMERGPPTMFN